MPAESSTKHNLFIQVASTLLGAGILGAIGWGATKVYAGKKLEIGLDGKPKMKIPEAIFNEKTGKNEAVIPVSVPIKITNTTFGTLSFSHPTANIYYQNIQIASSKPEAKKYELNPHSTVRLTIDFTVPVKEFVQGGTDAVKYFIGRFTGKSQPQRKLTLQTIVHAYGFTLEEPLDTYI